MSQLKLDDDGDLAIENGSFVIIRGQDEIKQNIIQRLRSVWGEWFLDTRAGVPWFDRILTKAPDPVVIYTLLANRILTTPGVVELLNFNPFLDIPKRVLKVENMRIRTKEGNLTISDFEQG